MQKIMLIILDGWGVGEPEPGNAIHIANTPFIDSLKSYPNSQLLTHGGHVGLPDGQMGNSEVGHMNIGAGRVVYQELARINKAFNEQKVKENNVLKKVIQQSKTKGKNIHLFGLVSDGGVHSHINHFKGLVDLFQKNDTEKVFIHAFTDGRDTDPEGGLNYLKELEEHINGKNAEVVSVIGRYYAMDRDKRWERTKLAYDLLVKGKGLKTTSLSESIKASYEDGVSDEFIKPLVKVDDAGNPLRVIEPGDIVLCVNFRTDRPRQITNVLTQESMPDFEMETLDLQFFTMTRYDSTFKGIDVVFNKENITETLGELLSKAGKKQIRIAETEKYPHVTFFFNGGQEIEFKGEKRIMIPSPKVATYDLQPEMSAIEMTEAILPEIEKAEADFICLNFANADMVGHTGIVEASVKACETVDACTKKIVALGLEKNYSFLITADHGNSDYMINDDGTPNTAHTTNPVPLYFVSNESKEIVLSNGKLGDLAPTILEYLGIEIPDQMTGKVLLNN